MMKRGFLFFLLFIAIPMYRVECAGWRFMMPHSMALGGVRSTGLMDAENLLLNPASLTKVEQNKISTSAGFQMTSIEIEDTYSSSVRSDDTIHPFGTLGVVWNMGTRLSGLGLSLTTFDHYKISFPEGGMQRFQCDTFRFDSYLLQVGIGFVPVRDLSIGISVGYLVSDGSWEMTDNPFRDSVDPDSKFDIKWKIEGSSYKDYTASVGLIWMPSYRFELGFVYQPPLAYHLKTDVTLRLPDTLGDVSLKSDMHDIRITIPQEARLGFHWIASERLDVFMDVGWQQYSQMDPVELAPDDPHPPALPESTIIPVAYDDRWTINLGGEFLMTDFVSLRLGGFFTSDIGKEGNEFIIFDSGRSTGVTAGIGIRFSMSSVDFMIGHRFSGSHDVSGSELPFPVSGDLKTQETFASLGMTFNF